MSFSSLCVWGAFWLFRLGTHTLNSMSTGGQVCCGRAVYTVSTNASATTHLSTCTLRCFWGFNRWFYTVNIKRQSSVVSANFVVTITILLCHHDVHLASVGFAKCVEFSSLFCTFPGFLSIVLDCHHHRKLILIQNSMKTSLRKVRQQTPFLSNSSWPVFRSSVKLRIELLILCTLVCPWSLLFNRSDIDVLLIMNSLWM